MSILISISDSIDLDTSSIYSRAVGAIANGLIGIWTIGNRLIAGSRAPCLSGTLLAFFLLGLNSLANPTLLVVEPLFIGDLVKLSSLEINSSLLAPLLLVELPTLAKLTTLVGELLFIGGLAELTLVLLTLKVGLIPIKGLAELNTLVVAEPIFIDSLVPLALFNCLAKSPFMEFSSLKLSQAVAPIESTSFFLGI